MSGQLFDIDIFYLAFSSHCFFLSIPWWFILNTFLYSSLTITTALFDAFGTPTHYTFIHLFPFVEFQ